jgi:pimeloyl-ACP methyl ester carboxylesterase
MPIAKVNGQNIGYDIIGEGDRGIAITAGGRFSKDTPGLRELAGELAKAGHKVLIWDRVNCGESDVNFDAETESILNAEMLPALMREINFGPALLVGGSAGSRVSLMTAIRHPDLVKGLFLLWISGGWMGLAVLAVHYCFASAYAAERQGMAAVADLPEWKEQVTRNPGNRDRFLAQDPDKFIATMQRWAGSFFPRSEAPVPGLNPQELATIKVPVVVLRSGKSDLHHTRETSELVHKMIPGSELREPPWGDSEWNDSMERSARDGSLFGNWPKLAPDVIALAKTL